MSICRILYTEKKYKNPVLLSPALVKPTGEKWSDDLRLVIGCPA